MLLWGVNMLNRLLLIVTISSLLLVLARIFDMVGLIKYKNDSSGWTATSWFITTISFVASFTCIYLSTSTNHFDIIKNGMSCILISCIPLGVWCLSALFKFLFIIFAHNKICPNCE